ncbi:MAG: sigma-70 family RNA polymerase sigma factor [Saprospiraceae bacterium]|nr:sigma-70 family RNA polymerase sigma factor [Saprospiraceae bacterium]
MVDDHIITLCRSGDRDGYRLMYTSCAPYIFAIVKNYFNTDDDRKDVLQEIFVQIFLSMDRFDENKGSFKAWISRIAVNQSISVLRKNNKLIISHSLELVDDVETETVSQLENFSEKDLHTMLAAMPEGYKTIFLLSVIEEYSHKEIGELLGITPETSRSQLFRAIKWIKKNIFEESNLINYGLL